MPLPGKEQLDVALRNVNIGSDSDKFCRSIDPTGWTFNLAKRANWSFVQYHVALSVIPLRPEFFVTERGLIS
jgi:hypothetical protein